MILYGAECNAEPTHHSFQSIEALSTLSALFFTVVNDLSELNLLFCQTSVNLNLNTPQVQSILLYY